MSDDSDKKALLFMFAVWAALWGSFGVIGGFAIGAAVFR